MARKTHKKGVAKPRVLARRKKSKPSARPTPERVIQFVWGFAPTFILDSAVRLRLFDFLESSPKTVEELARETGGSVRGLTALIEALAGLQFLKRQGNC